MSANVLKTLIFDNMKSTVDGVIIDDPSLSKFADAISQAIYTYLTTNLIVTIPVGSVVNVVTGSAVGVTNIIPIICKVV